MMRRISSVAPDHRIEFALARQIGEIERVAFQGLVFDSGFWSVMRCVPRTETRLSRSRRNWRRHG